GPAGADHEFPEGARICECPGINLGTLSPKLRPRKPLNVSGAAPQPLCGEPRSVGQRLQLRPGDIGMYFVPEAGRCKAAGIGRDDAFTSDDPGESLDALGDQLGVLDLKDAMRDYARKENLPVG